MPDHGKIEAHHVDVIDPGERHGRARDLFPVWFSANLNVGNAVFGALAVVVGNNLLWAAVAVVLGNVAGGVFMSLHSAQGAKLGVPQLIQSRGQFGYYGALLPVALAALLYLGFFVATAVIAGQALTAAVPAVDLTPAIVVIALFSLALSLLGYRAIHAAARWAIWPLALAVIVVTVAALLRGGVEVSTAGFQAGPFLTAFGLTATFVLTYAPYVSDYSRYLPEDTSPRAMFGWTFGGTFLGIVWSQLVGVLLAAQFAGGDVMAAVGDVLGNGAVAAVVLLVGAVAIGGNNALNLYGSMLNLITAATSFRPVAATTRVRLLMLLPTFVIGLLVALRASADFYTNLNNFLSFLQLAFVPWGAVNLIDYYLVRNGRYDVRSFFDRRGVYYDDPASWTRRGVNWQAMTAFWVGVACALPFVSNGWYAGPMAGVFNGADLSWIPGLLVSGLLYLAIARRAHAPARVARPVASA